ncbi:hypothetical protein ACWDKQ_00215 [Saccharopolyspora sp. NPDC000995]
MPPFAAAAAGLLRGTPPGHAAPAPPADVPRDTSWWTPIPAKPRCNAGEHEKFRSASVVKLLVAIDYLKTLDGKATAEDKKLLEPMLRSSNDDAASALWYAACRRPSWTGWPTRSVWTTPGPG